MCRLIETVKIYNGKVFNIDYHNQRLNNSRKTLFGCDDEIDLLQHIHITDLMGDGLYKFRILYSEVVESVELIPYTKRHLKTLKIIHSDQLRYDHKFEDRRQIHELFAQRNNCDDILIIKNHRLTDTSIGNIALFDGSKWFTPEFPLLKGTKRQMLLDEKKIISKDIRVADLKNYLKLCIFNAMIEFGEIEIPVSAIK